jgi:hypothetical protein
VKSVPYYVLALAMGIPALLVGVQIPAWLTLYRQTLAWHSDLRVYYTPAYMLRTGQASSIYDFTSLKRNEDAIVARDGGAVPFLHPAYEVLLFVPLSFLSYRAAYVAWVLVNLSLVGTISWLLRPYTADLAVLGPKWLQPALLLGFMPIAFTIFAGQDSLFLLLSLVLAYRLIPDHEVAAGLLFSLGMFRFQVLLPIAILFLLWRSLRFVAGWIAGSAVLLTISAAITGWSAQIQYIKLLHAMARASFWLMIQRMPNLRALFLASKLGAVPLALVCLSIIVFVAFLGRGQSTRRRLLLGISVSVLVTYYLFMHDVSVLALPVLVALNESVGARNWLRTALLAMVLCGFAIFWFSSLSSSRLYLGVLFSILFFVMEALDFLSAPTLRIHGARCL